MKQADRSSQFSLFARLKSFGHALDGFQFLLRSQHNAWLHLLVTLLVFGCGLALDITKNDWIIVTLAITLVWAAEAMNTAFEHLCDVVSPEHNMSVKHAKDIAAASVLICASGAAIIGTLTLMPYFIEVIWSTK